jgi:hypothetical protein
MKYAIGEILSLGVRSGMTFCRGTSMPHTTAEVSAKLVMKYAIGKNCFSRPSLGGAMIEVSHERFDWPKIA